MRLCLKSAFAFAMAVAAMWGAASSSSAHHLWVQETDGAYVVCRGMIGKRLDPYDPSCVTQISTKSPDGTDLSMTRTNEKERVVVTTNETPAIVSVTSEWGGSRQHHPGEKADEPPGGRSGRLYGGECVYLHAIFQNAVCPIRDQYPVPGIAIRTGPPCRPHDRGTGQTHGV